MKSCVSLGAICALAALLIVGCEDEPGGPTPTPTATAVYVLNVLGTTISVIDLEADSVYNDVAPVGTWPNHIVYRDGKLYCVNSGTNNIMIFNAETWAAETPIDLGSGNNPQNMVFTDDNTAYVTCSMSNKVLKVDMATKTVTKEIDAGVGTTGLAIANGKLYATNTAYDGATRTYGQGTVTVINTSTGTVAKTVNVGTNPQAIAVAPDGKLHVVCTGNRADLPGKVDIIDPATDTVVGEVPTGGTPGLIAISERDKLAYLGVWGLGALVYSTETLAQVHDTSDYFLGKGGTGLVTDPDGNIFISAWSDDQVIKLDKNGTVLGTYNVGYAPGSLAIKVTEK